MDRCRSSSLEIGKSVTQQFNPLLSTIHRMRVRLLPQTSAACMLTKMLTTQKVENRRQNTWASWVRRVRTSGPQNSFRTPISSAQNQLIISRKSYSSRPPQASLKSQRMMASQQGIPGCPIGRTIDSLYRIRHLLGPWERKRRLSRSGSSLKRYP